MEHTERELCAALCQSRKQSRYTNKSYTWPQFVEEFKRRRKKTGERYAEFMALDQDTQADIKDIGGFVGGRLKNGSRKAVEFRDLLCLDIDYAAPDFIGNWELAYDGVRAIVHSTHKHSKDAPRLRLITPLSRAVSTEEYQAIGRRVAQSLGLEQFDRTTYDYGRMMYWQSFARDADVVFNVYDGAPLDVEQTLATYEDWHNIAEWPTGDREVREQRGLMQNPLEKSGLIGAFCRCYSISEAIAAFIPEYVPAGTNRYTYTGGTTSGGVVTYDDLFSYSYHDHDPACGIECNAFDLVRLHKFSDKDKGRSARDISKLPSMRLMMEFAAKDAKVAAYNAEEHLKGFDIEDDEADTYREQLIELEQHLTDRDKSGRLRLSLQNIKAMFAYHPDLRGLLAWDEFRRQIVLLRSPSWRKVSPADNAIRDIDDAQIRGLFEQYDMIGKDRIYDAANRDAHTRKIHPVRDYLKSLTWDGVPRIATALNDFFGGEPTAYSTYISALFFKAGVMRVFRPGCQFDTMLTIKGPQGCGKSTFFRKIGGAWFSDSIKDLRNKDAVEGLQGVWVIEFSELSAMKRADAELIKSFLSATKDRFRMAYGRRTEEYPRQCVFGASTNEVGFLYDQTGNRRFLIFEVVKGAEPRLDIFTQLTQDYVDQLWAEAYAAVEKENFETCLALPRDIEKTAFDIQASFMQDDPLADDIRAFLELDLPEDWYDRSLDLRRRWTQSALKGEPEEPGIPGNKRQLVCAAEIWQEILKHSDVKDMSRADAQNINRILDNLPGWRRAKNAEGGLKAVWIKGYGAQKGFERVP